MAALAARAFKVWKTLRNRVVLPVKRISYFLRFLLLSVVYYCWNHATLHEAETIMVYLLIVKILKFDLFWNILSKSADLDHLVHVWPIHWYFGPIYRLQHRNRHRTLHVTLVTYCKLHRTLLLPDNEFEY